MKTVLEKVSTTRTVGKILEVVSEKYEIMKSERILELMRKIFNFLLKKK